MEWYTYVGIVAVGIISGFINILAGSGSLLTLPLLMFLGLPANIANGTNRVSILFQNLVSVGSFKQQKVLNLKQGLWLAIPTVIGSIAGAQIAVSFNEKVMKTVIGILLIFMFFMILLKPEVWIKGRAGETQAKATIWQIVIFFFIGIYGGFIQAGVGLFLLAGLVWGVGLDLVKANSLKVFIVLLYTPFALTIFILNQQIDWRFCFILAIGSMIGALIGSRVAVKKGAKFIWYIVLFAILASALELFGVYNWLGKLIHG